MRRTKQKDESLGPARKQREVIREVMLSAGQCATWLTLDELAKFDALPAGEYLRAVAAPAEAAVWGVCGGEALPNDELGHARGRVRRGLGRLGDAGAARAGT